MDVTQRPAGEVTQAWSSAEADPVSMRESLEMVLRSLGSPAGRPLPSAEEWASVVGPSLARLSRPGSWQSGRLLVLAKSAPAAAKLKQTWSRTSYGRAGVELEVRVTLSTPP